MKVMDGYGGPHCNCCGETRVAFLQVDHINNDGAKHRKEVCSGEFYRWIIKNNFPKDLQILCANCNWGKYRNGGVCPHVHERNIASLEAKKASDFEPFTFIDCG